MDLSVSRTSNSSKARGIPSTRSNETIIVELVTRKFNRLETLHAVSVVSNSWHCASAPIIRTLRNTVLGIEQVEQPMRRMALQYAESRLINHSLEQTPQDLQALSNGFVTLVGHFPATAKSFAYVLGVLPHLKNLSAEDWVRLQMSTPQASLRLLQLTACYCDQSPSILQDPTLLGQEQNSLNDHLLLALQSGSKHTLEPLLDHVVQMKWNRQAALALFHALQSMKAGARKCAAVEAVLEKNPPLPVLLDCIGIKECELGVDGKRLKKSDVQLRCLVLAKLIGNEALRNEKNSAKTVMLALSDCADNLSGKKAKNAFFLALTTHFKNVKPLAIEHPNLLCLLCARAKELRSSCPEAKAFLAGLEFHGISYKNGTLTPPKSGGN